MLLGSTNTISFSGSQPLLVIPSRHFFLYLFLSTIMKLSMHTFLYTPIFSFIHSNVPYLCILQFYTRHGLFGPMILVMWVVLHRVIRCLLFISCSVRIQRINFPSFPQCLQSVCVLLFSWRSSYLVSNLLVFCKGSLILLLSKLLSRMHI